jgi:hypothetical protein
MSKTLTADQRHTLAMLLEGDVLSVDEAGVIREILATQQPEPRDEVTDAAIAAVDRVLKANAVFFGRLKLQEIVNAARTGASHE